MTELVIAVGAAVGLSATCSLLEAVLYSVPLGHVESLAAQGRATGRILRRLRERIDRPIAAILSLNTIANTAGAAVAGAAAAAVFGHEDLLWFSAAFTLAILLCSEVVPKTIGVVYSRELAGVVARPIQAMVWVLGPLVWLTGLVTQLLSRGRVQSQVSGEELRVMARLGMKTGAIEAAEAAVIENVLTLTGRTAADIMTPRTVVFSLRASLTLRELQGSGRSVDYSRVPVYDDGPDDVVGMVHLREVLTAMANGQVDRTLESFMRPLDFVPGTISADRLLRRFLERRQHMAMVIDEYGGLDGLVTLEDVLEEILGEEIVDEFDPAVDMRELARRRRRASATPAAPRPE